MTSSANELTHLVSELQTVEEQLEDKLESLNEPPPPPSSSKSIHELGDLMSEFQTAAEELNHRLKQEQKDDESLPTDVAAISTDILQHRRESKTIDNDYHRKERRPSSPPTSPLLKKDFVHVTCTSMNDVDQVRDQLLNEQEENNLLHDMIETIIQQAQDIIQTEESIVKPIPMMSLLSPRLSIPTSGIDQRRLPFVQSSGTSISDEFEHSHEDSTIDRTSELAAQLDYLRRMSRYENLMDEHHQQYANLGIRTNQLSLEEDASIQMDDSEGRLTPSNYLTVVREEPLSLAKDDDDEQEDEKETIMKKKKPKTKIDDDKSFSEHDDDDNDDNDDDHREKPPVISSTGGTTSSKSATGSEHPTQSSPESGQQKREQSDQYEQMDMSRDSIDDAVFQRSTDSLESEQELKFSPSETPTLDDYRGQRPAEPTPSRMMTTHNDEIEQQRTPAEIRSYSIVTGDDEETEDKAQPSPIVVYPLISNEIESGQLPVIHARRTASENSLCSTSSSSVHIYESHSLSATCLTDNNETTTIKDDLTPSNENYQIEYYDDDHHHQQQNENIYRATTRTDDNEDNNLSSSPTGAGFFDRVKAFVTKPVELVQEAMENRRKQRSRTSLSSNPDLSSPGGGGGKQTPDDHDEQQLISSSNSPRRTSQHFQSAYDLHEEEGKSKLVRSPELYNMDHVVDNRHLLLINTPQHRTQSESSLMIEQNDDSKMGSIATMSTSNEASEEFLTTISKENSLEFVHQQQQRRSTPYDDVVEKESSPEHSESYSLPTTAFSDAFEPTSSCQRPLALSVPGQQKTIPSEETMTESEFDLFTSQYVNQVLNEAVSQLTGEHIESSSSHESNESVTSEPSDDDEDELQEEGEVQQQQQEQHLMHTDTSSIGFNDRYSADESSNTQEQSATSSATTTPTKQYPLQSSILRRAETDTKGFDIERTPTTLAPPVRRNSQSDTGTYFSAISPSSGDYVDVQSSYSTLDGDKLLVNVPTRSSSSQYVTAADDDTTNMLTSDENELVDRSGTMNLGYDDSDLEEKQIEKATNLDEEPAKHYSGEGEESSGGGQPNLIPRRKRSNDQRTSFSLDISLTGTGGIFEANSPKNVSFKLEKNEIFVRSPRPSTSGASSFPRQESLESPPADSSEKTMVKTLQEEILRANLDALGHDLELNVPISAEPTNIERPTTTTTTKQTASSYSDYDAGSESDREDQSVPTDDSEEKIKSSIREELTRVQNEMHNETESLIDKIKLKLERSIDRLVAKTLAGDNDDDDTHKSDLISPFTDRSLERFSPANIEQQEKQSPNDDDEFHPNRSLTQAHSEQLLPVSADEFDYGSLQRFSSDSCIFIRVPEQYTPSSTLFLDGSKRSNAEKEDSPSKFNEQPSSAFSYYVKQNDDDDETTAHMQQSSSPIRLTQATSETIENISPIPNRYTPRSIDDSLVDFGERDMTDMSDEFVLVKNLSSETLPSPIPVTSISVSPSKESKPETPSLSSGSSSSSSDKYESPDLLEIIKHECDYPPLDTGFEIRPGTMLETVYESPELRQDSIITNDEVKPALSTLSLATSDNNDRPPSIDRHSSTTPNTDDSLVEFERLEMELLKTPSTMIAQVARDIRSSVDSLLLRTDSDKVETFIEKHAQHFSLSQQKSSDSSVFDIEDEVKNLLDDLLELTSDLPTSISSEPASSSQSDATTVIFNMNPKQHSLDDDFVQITREDLKTMSDDEEQQSPSIILIEPTIIHRSLTDSDCQGRAFTDGSQTSSAMTTSSSMSETLEQPSLPQIKRKQQHPRRRKTNNGKQHTGSSSSEDDEGDDTLNLPSPILEQTPPIIIESSVSSQINHSDKRRLSAPIDSTHGSSTTTTTRRTTTPSSSSSSSSSFSSTSRSVIYSQQHSQPTPRICQAETDLASFKLQQQTQSATDLPFLPPFTSSSFVHRSTMKSTQPSSSSSSSSMTATKTAHSTPSLSRPIVEPIGNNNNNRNNNNNNSPNKKTHSHPGSLGGSQIPPPLSTSKEGISSSSSSHVTSTSHHRHSSSSSSSHHSDDYHSADPTTTTTTTKFH